MNREDDSFGAGTPVREGDCLEGPLVVEQVAFGGQGLVRLSGGKVCFVPWVIPGERVTVRIRRERTRFAEAEVEQIVEASADRVEPACAVFGRCGGCHYQHMTYARQLVVKRDQVADTLRRIGGVEDVSVEPTLPSGREYAYRNRVTVHVRKGRIGFYAPKSRDVIGVESCPIATAPVNALLAELRRSRPQDGEYPLREPGEFRGFRQVNDFAAGVLADLVAEMAAPGGALLVDAYCGAGFFSRHLRAVFREVIGIEWSADAVRFARRQAADRETYLAGDVSLHLPTALNAAPAAETTVLLDPPSEGLAAQVVDVLLRRSPARILYVSCNPSTLARDIKRLRDRYRVKRVRPVDMFPQTAEIEVATLLELL